MQRKWTELCRGRACPWIVKEIGVGTGGVCGIHDADALHDGRKYKGILLPDSVERAVVIDSVTAANGGLSGLEGIPGKANARGKVLIVVGVHPVAEGGTFRRERRAGEQGLSGSTTILTHDDTVGVVSRYCRLTGHEAARGGVDGGCRRGIKGCWIEVVQNLIDVPRRGQEAVAQADI